MKYNIAVGQSGGPTAAINATLCGVIEGALQSGNIDKILGCVNGIEGVLNENFADLSQLFASEEKRKLLKQTPAAFLGSCRKRLPQDLNDAEYKKIIDVLQKNNVKYFVYIGGNDSMDTVDKLSRYAKENNIDINFVGAPKTIDNDLAVTDFCPGFGSAAKYIATTVRELAIDAAVYSSKSVLIVEAMGRNAGWLTAASALARTEEFSAPHLIYVPERAFSIDKFIEDIKNVDSHSVVVVVSEGVKDENGTYICEGASSGVTDVFGHKMLSGTGKVLENIVRERLGVKVRSVELNTCQRCASHIRSEVDIQTSVQIGKEAALSAIEGKTGVMMYFERTGDSFKVKSQDISLIANEEKMLCDEFINKEGNNITDKFIEYVKPLIKGEAELICRDGMPVYIKL